MAFHQQTLQFQRVSPNAVRVFAPVETVREAAWYALVNERIRTPVIDVEKNIVSAIQGDGFLSARRVITARFRPDPEGTLVTFESKVLLAIDFGARRRAKKLANSFERVLASGYSPTPVVEQRQNSQSSAPIADPFSTEVVVPDMTAKPIYGIVLAPGRGNTLLAFSVFSLIGAVFLIPVVLINAIIALRDYKQMGDPGDKRLIIAALVVSALAIFEIGFLFSPLFLSL